MFEKMIITGLILIISITGFFIWRWYIKHKGKVLHENIQSQKESAAGRQLELEVLKEKMDEAIHSLKTSELAVQYRGSSALYALPWFMVIGPSAAGKSTLLRHSGLHFSLSSEEDIRIKGYGGTRNCDWWFADEAIFLDTAGRYTTEEDDSEEWQSFLRLLKKYRPKLPINGILVVISLTEIVNLDEEGLKKHTKLIRERISEMTSTLGYLFPVYICLTKMDLITGFSDFFKSEEQSVLGIYLGGNTQEFKIKLNSLYDKLLNLVMKQLYLENQKLTQLDIINFPAEFNRARKSLESFMALLFKDNPYQETPNFMGVYFTSATEQSYFIKAMFSKVVFPHQFSAQKSHQKLLNLRWLKTASVIAGMGAVAGAFLLYSASFTANNILLRQGVELTKQSMDATDKLQSLKQLADYVLELESYQDNIPLHLRLGLYRGNDLLPYLTDYLKASLKKYFLTPTATELESELMRYQEQWALNTDAQNQLIRGDYYTTLKVYLMLCDPKRMDPDLATTILAKAWSKQNGLDFNLLISMVNFYITAPDRVGWGEKADVVQLSRQQLASKADVNNLYAGLREKGINRFKLLSIQHFSSKTGLSLFFTKDTYENWVKKEIENTANDAMKGDWVMGSFQPTASSDQVAQLRLQLTQLYFSDYIHNWLIYLQTIHLDTFQDMDNATKELNIISSNQGPIAELLLIANQNLDIEDSPVKAKFHELINLSPDIIQNYLKQLSSVKNLLEKLMASSDLSRDSQTYASQILSGNGSQSELYQASVAANTIVTAISDSEVKQVLQNILLTPVRESWRLILHEATNGLDAQWQSQVITIYKQSLAHKFPFEPNGEDADKGDISRFFNESNGVLWQFVNQNLISYLQQTPDGWQERTWLDVGVGFTPQFLSILTRAKTISDGFFTENSTDPKFTFEIYPEPTPGIREISLVTNGQTYRYRNDPQEWQKMHWPGEEPNDDTALSIISAKDDTEGSIEINSLWGFFKLLKQASLSKDEGSAMRATWTIKHYRVSFLVRSSQSNNLFSALMIDKFNLPEHLCGD